MFNLGYKEVILNNLDGVTTGTVAGTIDIAGFGMVVKADMVGSAPVAPASEVADWTTLPTVGDLMDVKIVTKRIETDYKETIHFTALGVTGGDVDTAFRKWKDTYDQHIAVVSVGGTGTTVTTTIKAGSEMYFIDSVFVRVIDKTNIENAQPEERLVKAITNEGDPGKGQGWQIEASRKLGTFVNSNPYGQQHGGNSIGIDLEAQYKEYNVTSSESVNTGWAKDEYVKHDFINADTVAKDFRFVIYVHEDFVAAFEAL